jgi:alkanesulfonate monooxygenase SsuD/methylene tetrahydromethanopterin reductase-like flavin-dependent oxidoreductase (luciferase family)
MEFLVALPAKIDEPDHPVRAEAGGFDYFGAGEGPLLWSDPYQYLALASQRTSEIKLGTCVTNPVTRIPPQTANSVATLNRLAPGRVFMGIGAANNAMRSMGRPPATIKETEHAVTVSSALLRGERTVHTWRGEDREVEFLAPEQGWINIEDKVETWVSAGGPRSLGVAARTADVVVYCLGPDPTLIKVVRERLDEELVAAGRDPQDVRLAALTWFYEMQPGDTIDEAITQGFGSGPISSCITNAAFMAEHVDELGPEIVEAVGNAAGSYLSLPPDGSTHYLDVWRKYLNGLDPRHKDLITKQLVDYFCLYGTPEELQEKVSVMRDAGVDCISVFLSNPMTFSRDIENMSKSLVAHA